jgi:hypothetical protein
VLRETVDLFSIFDVDERLIWIADNGWLADKQIVARLEETGAIYPTTWLINAIGSASRFTLLDTERRPGLSNNLKWGKPILPPPLIGLQAGIHNIQYAGRQFSTTCASSLFLLHLTQFPEQRIAANVKKLVNRGLVEPSISPEAIASMDFSAYPDKTVLRFQGEIAEMIAYLKGDRSIASCETEWLELAEDGAIKYSSEAARATLLKHIEEGAATIENTFK